MGDGVQELVKGDDWVIKCVARLKNSGDPFDLTGASEISVKLKKSDGTALEKKLSLGAIAVTNDELGKFEVTVPKVDSASVAAGEAVSFDAVITKASKDTTVRFVEVLSIFDRVV